MLTEICAYLKNYFLVDYANVDKRIYIGTFQIASGKIQALPFLIDGQHYRIVGSVFNDGVWEYHSPENVPEGAPQLRDETFDGAIWAMSIPPDVLSLANDISAWVTANSSAVNSPYQSESFGGYSYTIKSGSGSGGSGSDNYDWRDQFADRLAPYRRLSVL